MTKITDEQSEKFLGQRDFPDTSNKERLAKRVIKLGIAYILLLENRATLNLNKLNTLIIAAHAFPDLILIIYLL